MSVLSVRWKMAWLKSFSKTGEWVCRLLFSASGQGPLRCTHHYDWVAMAMFATIFFSTYISNSFFSLCVIPSLSLLWGEGEFVHLPSRCLRWVPPKHATRCPLPVSSCHVPSGREDSAPLMHQHLMICLSDRRLELGQSSSTLRG